MQPILFVSHGGGPLPILGDPSHEDMLRAFRDLRNTLEQRFPKPDALVFISAHWESSPIAITSSAKPSLYYDYYGFPEEAYTLQYPAPGAPELASQLAESLRAAKIDVQLDTTRGLDHGVFIPGKLLFPEADIPCLQISLHPNLDPATHLYLGEQLAQLAYGNILVIGSGFSFHNMRAFFAGSDLEADQKNLAFEEWLEDTLRLDDADDREARLTQWEKAPHARFCHPREEHLLPLHVCVGAAQHNRISERWRFSALKKQGSCYMWIV